MKKDLFSRLDIAATYEEIYNHLATRSIIRRHSQNKEDVRTKALEWADLSNAKKVLDIGCGYGFFIESLKDRLAPDARITGIDIIDSNREAYLNTIASAGYRGQFITSHAEIIKMLRDDLFDFVISSYSLYFFPHILEEIRRVMKPAGIFCAITHSRNSLKEIISPLEECIQYYLSETGPSVSIRKLFEAFSAEEGKGLLKKMFDDIHEIPYKNSLVFTEEEIEECIFYIQKKESLFFKDIELCEEDIQEQVRGCLYSKIKGLSQQTGIFSINKNDAIFICRKESEAS